MLNRTTRLHNFADAGVQIQRRRCSISAAEALNFNAVCILRKLGFEVIEGLNLTLTETSEMVNSFLRDLDNYSTGLLFYAGHGMQIDGKNYIVPVDCKILDQSQTIFSCYCIDDYLSNLNVYKGKTNIIILDACRNNPFARGRGMILLSLCLSQKIYFMLRSEFLTINLFQQKKRLLENYRLKQHLF